MYANKKLQVVNGNQSYIDSNGIKYPSNYPKDKIAELYKVKETEPPTDKIVEGFFINENFEQVWNVRDKNEEELNAELIAEAYAMLEKTDVVANRCFKSGIAFPVEWLTYVEDLRGVVNGNILELPITPAYPEGS